MNATEIYTGILRWQYGSTIYRAERLSGGYGIRTEAGQLLYSSHCWNDVLLTARRSFGLE